MVIIDGVDLAHTDINAIAKGQMVITVKAIRNTLTLHELITHLSDGTYQ